MVKRIILRPWYKNLVIIWLAIGLPSLILSTMFAEGDIASMFAVGDMSFDDLILRVTILVFLLAPVLFAPIGFKSTSGK